MPIQMKHFGIAIIIAAILAIPFVTFICSIVVFPLLPIAMLAAYVNFAPVVLVPAFVIRNSGVPIDFETMYARWLLALIVWIGCSYGISRWDLAARSMGARQEPYLKVFLAPWNFVIGW